MNASTHHEPSHLADALRDRGVDLARSSMRSPELPWPASPLEIATYFDDTYRSLFVEAFGSDYEAMDRFDHFIKGASRLVDLVIETDPLSVHEALRGLHGVDVPIGDCVFTAKLEALWDRRDEMIEFVRAHLGVEPVRESRPDIHLRLVGLP